MPRVPGENSQIMWGDQQPVTQVTCEQCGAVVPRPTKEVKRAKPGRRWFCRRECFHAWQRANAVDWMVHCRLRSPD